MWVSLDKRRVWGYTEINEGKEADPMALDFSKYEGKRPSNCESCQFYDYDEDYDCYVCTLDLDEDEMQDHLSGNSRDCHYYRYYDEYKSVQKQI